MLGRGYTITRSVTGYITLTLLLVGLWFGAILIKIGICGIRAKQVGKKTSILDFLFLGDVRLKTTLSDELKRAVLRVVGLGNII